MQVSVGLDAFGAPRKPNVVMALAASEPLNDRFLTVTFEPFVVSAPFQSWVMVCPLASVQVTVQALMAALPAFTVTSAWKPPDHAFTVLYVAEQAPVTGGVVTGGVVSLGTGNDTVTLFNGTNSVTVSGAETVTGGTGADVIKSGGGRDKIDARDGEVDVIDCGKGKDTVRAEPNDRLTRCELSA